MPVTSGFSCAPISIEFKKFIKKINIGIEVPEELLEGVMCLGVNTTGEGQQKEPQEKTRP